MATQTIYDHPLYYDVLFGFDRSREADFYHAAFAHAGVAPGERVLELACGPARVARLLARRGYPVTGLDHSAGMLAFARAAAEAEGIRLETLRADMTGFACEATPFAGAYNPLSSFRLLHRDDQAEAHLRCVAAALRPGGVYVLDLAFQARVGDPVTTTDEAWEMQRGDVSVRADDAGVEVLDAGRRLRLAWGAEGHLRGYTAETFAKRVAACPELALVSWHPEASRASGEFDPSRSAPPPRSGRAMVVLRRRT